MESIIREKQRRSDNRKESQTADVITDIMEASGMKLHVFL